MTYYHFLVTVNKCLYAIDQFLVDILWQAYLWSCFDGTPTEYVIEYSTGDSPQGVDAQSYGGPQKLRNPI